jgi:hypothetical protein
VQDDKQHWYAAAPIDESKEDGDALELPSRVFEYVDAIESDYSWFFLRLFKLNCLYDPLFERFFGDADAPNSVSESVVASSVDTVTGIVATSEIRPRILVDEGDWSEHRRAVKLSWYGEAIGKKIHAHDLAVNAFKSGALKGSAFIKVVARPERGEIDAEQVLVEDLIVPDSQGRAGKMPRQMHHRTFVEREELKRLYPGEDAAEAIDNAAGGRTQQWAGYRPYGDDEVVVIESWHLPCGTSGKKHYSPGRHSICIEGHALLDEPYHKPYFPIACFFWTRRDAGFYGIGGGERIAGLQEQLTQLNHQVRRQQYKCGNPTVWAHISDANLQVRTVRRLGDLGLYKSHIPKTEIPQAVSPETYAERERTRDHAFEEFGISRLAATAKKPGRLDSGAAIREYTAATTQRFAPQEKGFERLVLDTIWLAIDACKDLAAAGKEPPAVVKKLARGRKKLIWKDVDPAETRLQMQAAATLSRTPWGRTQMVLEWAQGGLISQDEARQMLAPFDPLDTAKTVSLYSAALDNIDLTIEEILEGERLVPEPFQNVQIGVWRVQQKYLEVKGDGAPEEILEALRQWAVQAAFIASKAAEMAAAPANVTPATAIAPEAKQIAGIG